jgi:HEAT repeat protein
MAAPESGHDSSGALRRKAAPLVEAPEPRLYNEPARRTLAAALREERGKRPVTTQPEAAPNPPATPQASAPNDPTKIVLAAVLVLVAAYLIASRYRDTTVDWYLGDLRRDPGNAEARAAFAELGDRAIPKLTEELKSTDDDSRVVAIFALASMRGGAADALLAGATKDEDWLTASNALAACGARLDAATGKAICEALRDPRMRVQLAARHFAGRRFGAPWWALGRSEVVAKR